MGLENDGLTSAAGDEKQQMKRRWWHGDSSIATDDGKEAVTGVAVSVSPSISQDGESEAATYLRQHEEWAGYDEAEAKRVLRKIDWRLQPLIISTVTIAAIDKILISNAALYSMNKDLHVAGQQYSWIASIFYFGWLISEYPSNALLQKLPVGKTVGTATLLWGGILMCMGAAQSVAGLMVLRFILGVLEAPLYPAIAIMNAMWYKKCEQPSRTAWSFTSYYSLVVGPVSYGIGLTNLSIARWRLLYLTFGSVTVLWAIVVLIWLPDSPLNENFLSGKDKYIALDRVKSNMTGIENKKLKWYQVREAFTDYKTYLLAIFFFSMAIPLAGLNTFAAQIVSGFGFDVLPTVLLGMPTGVLQSLSGVVVAIPQRWMTNKRCVSAALCSLIPILCSVLLRKLPNDNKVGRLMVYYAFYTFWGSYGTALSLPMSNVAGHTKRLTVNATIFFAFCIANIVGPQVFIAKEQPHYRTGYNAIIVADVVAILSIMGYAIGCAIENRRRDRVEGPIDEVVEISVEYQLGDLTDGERKGFRYVY